MTYVGWMCYILHMLLLCTTCSIWRAYDCVCITHRNTLHLTSRAHNSGSNSNVDKHDTNHTNINSHNNDTNNITITINMCIYIYIYTYT